MMDGQRKAVKGLGITASKAHGTSQHGNLRVPRQDFTPSQPPSSPIESAKTAALKKPHQEPLQQAKKKVAKACYVYACVDGCCVLWPCFLDFSKPLKACLGFQLQHFQNVKKKNAYPHLDNLDTALSRRDSQKTDLHYARDKQANRTPPSVLDFYDRQSKMHTKAFTNPVLLKMFACFVLVSLPFAVSFSDQSRVFVVKT